jgi:hypothetical protein
VAKFVQQKIHSQHAQYKTLRNEVKNTWKKAKNSALNTYSRNVGRVNF